MPRKIDAGEVLAAVGGALIFVALFLTWFGDFTGWGAFEALDLVIAALALLAVAAAVASATGWSSGPTARILPWLGVVLLVIIAVQLIDPPPTLFDVERIGEDGIAAWNDPERETGAWLALAGAALVLLGGVLRAAHISVTVSVGNRDVRRRVPAVDRRPGAAPSSSASSASSAESRISLEPEQATQPFEPATPPTEER